MKEKLELEQQLFDLTPEDKRYVNSNNEKFIFGTDRLVKNSTAYCYWAVSLFSIEELEQMIKERTK
jgi:hypothetical protein